MIYSKSYILLPLILILTSCAPTPEEMSKAALETFSEQISIAATIESEMNSIPAYMKGVWLCTYGEPARYDDLTTEQMETMPCTVSVEYSERFAVVSANGIPNHDFESGLGCCTEPQEYVWRIPLQPTITDKPNPAPKRGPVAISINGAPFYGPEDGPGGDAVAAHHDYYVEDRQPITLGVCGGHSGPGGAYHYHYDANCVHWHPDENKSSWKDWSTDLLQPDDASPVIGFAFDGYPIYGPYGYDDNGNIKEMKSSYRLKQGYTGYGGIDDWEYVKDLGDLDECNGIISKLPATDEPTYHYHASIISGSAEIGFPYFILCYAGEPELSNFQMNILDAPHPPEDGLSP